MATTAITKSLRPSHIKLRLSSSVLLLCLRSIFAAAVFTHLAVAFQPQHVRTPRDTRRRSSHHVLPPAQDSPLSPSPSVRKKHKSWTYRINNARLASANARKAVILVDFENVRGTTQFSMSHVDLFHAISIWCQSHAEELDGRVCLIMDHGLETQGYYIGNNNREDGVRMAVLFSGLEFKADDVIVRDATEFYQEVRNLDVIVVTADMGVMSRCHNTLLKQQKDQATAALLEAEKSRIKSGAKKPKRKKKKNTTKGNNLGMEILSPTLFLEELDRAVFSFVAQEQQGQNNGNLDSFAVVKEPNVNDSDGEINSMRYRKRENSEHGDSVNNATTSRKKNTKKPKPKRGKRVDRLKEMLSLLSFSQSSLLPTKLENAVLPETVGDNRMLAEEFRQQVKQVAQLHDAGIDENLQEDITSVKRNHDTGTSACIMKPVEAHVKYYNILEEKEQINRSLLRHDFSEDEDTIPTAAKTTKMLKQSPLRIVILSDTHGYEDALTNSDPALEPWVITHYCGTKNNPHSSEGNRNNEEKVSLRDDYVTKPDRNHESSPNIPMETTSAESASTSSQGKYHALPEGDILLHLGDFTANRTTKANRKQHFQNFDEWLSLHPHPVKIVLRGNHDPQHQVKFQKSKALYIHGNQPQSLEIHGWKFTLVPSNSSTNKSSNQPSKQKGGSNVLRIPHCDILATHEPPHEVLDQSISNHEHVGSKMLRHAVEDIMETNSNNDEDTSSPSDSNKKPQLWLCGHIHEGRGVQYAQFRNDDKSLSYEGTSTTTTTTMVLNAANANPGRARGVVNGPVVVDLIYDP